MSAQLWVCPLSRLAETAAASQAGHLVSLRSPGTPEAVRPAGIEAGRHLTLTVSDIATTRDGHVLAEAGHVQDLLDFVTAWDRARPLLIHCYAGVSRSTAGALIAACALDPGRDEAEVAWALRSAAPTATPNPRLVAVADALLEREGRLLAATAAIGRGADCFEGSPFFLPIG